MGYAEKLASLSEKFNLEARYGSHQPDARPSPGLTELVDRATKGGNHVIFGEPHIGGLMVKQYELMANNPEMFKKAADNGVKNLVLEMPPELQSAVDSFAAGKITRADFSDRLDILQTPWAEGAAKNDFKNYVARTVENAHAAGMKVHLADVKANKDFSNLDPPSVVALEKNLIKQYGNEKPDMTLTDYLQKKLAEMPKAELEKLRRDVEEHTEKWRAERFDDTEQYLYLRERIPAHEGIMGVVGLGHLNNSMDISAGHKIMGIDDHLEAEGRKVTTIEVHSDKTKNFMRELTNETQHLPQDRPDYVINLDKRSIESEKDGVVTIAPMDHAGGLRLTERRMPQNAMQAPEI